MNPKDIEHRIQLHRDEMMRIQKAHELMVANFEQQSKQHQSRYAQLQGAILELEFLKKQTNEQHTGIAVSFKRT